MAKENKRYYWIQLAQDFFKSKEMKLLRKIAGGDTYTIIYLKLMLMSLEDSGKIYYDGIAENLAEEIGLVIDENIEDIKLTLAFLESKGLLTKRSEREYFLEQVPEMVGSETASTRRSRKHREQKTLQCNTVATIGNGEKEKEKEKEKEEYIFPDWLSEESIESVKKGNYKNYIYRIPIAYLNQVTGRNIGYIDSNLKFVKARFKEKPNIKFDDFKKVVDIKFSQWANDVHRCKYLRPSTLFGPKFDDYLNECIPIKNQRHSTQVDERLGF
ncbi:phage replisome organizer N-terminal domain-containing protein [Streptococcus sanguinis]|uniref:phage replisome organizer N-terminal domain-containing protein n=1 Tax=Streptococcus sanguinis TaxID=1305 RepID=UPI000FB0A956|nr:phage replisome organizer N-terminal domain-containing protein [Streptococcus sanguinis]RSI51551.1 hypothetical protein D8870_09665 [Streptococcus sanguinis]